MKMLFGMILSFDLTGYHVSRMNHMVRAGGLMRWMGMEGNVS